MQMFEAVSQFLPNIIILQTYLRVKITFLRILVKMDCFELLQKHLAMCAIDVSQKPAKNHPFNVKNLIVLISVCVTVALILGSWNEDNSFDEHTDLIFRSLSIGASAIIYAIIVCNTSELSAFINCLADTVKASERKTMIQFEK